MEERACESEQGRHALCESKLQDCNPTTTSAFELSEDKMSYFEDGNWIFGDRKYIVNWQHKPINDTVAYCKNLNLEVFEPGNQERDLIPYLKLWGRHITVSQYWTSLTYETSTKEFYDKSGMKVNVKNKINFSERDKRKHTGRSKTSTNQLCVAMSVSYELTSQMPCVNESTPNCAWSFLQYVPANCNNHHSIICQHKDKDLRNIHWRSDYFGDISRALVDSAVTTFGYPTNRDTYRSKFKQIFGSLVCPKGYRMLRENNTVWSVKPTDIKDNLYSYDYMESYWVVDKHLFRKEPYGTCTISVPDKDGHSRKLSKVSCDSWHFYICEKDDKSAIRIPFTGHHVDKPTMNWEKGPQERIYPIVRECTTNCSNTSAITDGRKVTVGTKPARKLNQMYIRKTNYRIRIPAPR